MIASLFEAFLPVITVALGVAALGGSGLSANPPLWRATAAAAGLLAVLGEALRLSTVARHPTENVLARDATALLALAAVVVLLMAFVAAKAAAAGWGGPAPVAASALAGLLLLAASPIVLLFVHCTSGDCL